MSSPHLSSSPPLTPDRRSRPASRGPPPPAQPRRSSPDGRGHDGELPSRRVTPSTYEHPSSTSTLADTLSNSGSKKFKSAAFVENSDDYASDTVGPAAKRLRKVPVDSSGGGLLR